MRFAMLRPVVAALTLALAGCEDFLAEEPEDSFTPENFPASEGDLAIALGGINSWYTTESGSSPYFGRGWPMLVEVPSDQTVAQQTNGSRHEQDSFTFSPENEWLWRVWRQIYGAINHGNLLIERIPQLTGVPQEVRDRYLGAFKFHRAFNHFNAVRVWGSVPVMMAPIRSVAEASAPTRAPIGDVYAAIAADLEDAATLLPSRWPDSDTPDDGRPTRGAAYTMLADVYMNMSGALVQQNRWADAARAARWVIDSGGYSLVPNFADLWLIRNKNGPEHIYSIQYEGLQDNVFTTQSRPGGIGTESGFNYWFSTADFMDTFDSLDARKGPTFLTQVTVGTTTYRYDTLPQRGFGDKRPRFPRPMPYYGKFFDANGSIQQNSQRTDLNWPIYRYADVLLMFAEAENEASGPTLAAFDAINQVRARANLLPLLALDQAQLRAAVRQERSWELAFEGKRLFDLKRWGLFHSVLSADPVASLGVQPHHVFLAIPQRERDLAPSLGQNPGY